MDSPDLYHWELAKSEIPDLTPEKVKVPEVFKWKGWFWMVKDIWKGLAVYRSPNLDNWTRTGVMPRQTPVKDPAITALGNIRVLLFKMTTINTLTSILFIKKVQTTEGHGCKS